MWNWIDYSSYYGSSTLGYLKNVTSVHFMVYSVSWLFVFMKKALLLELCYWIFHSYIRHSPTYEIYSEIVNSSRLVEELYARRIQKLIFVHLFTELFHEDFSLVVIIQCREPKYTCIYLQNCFVKISLQLSQSYESEYICTSKLTFDNDNESELFPYPLYSSCLFIKVNISVFSALVTTKPTNSTHMHTA